MNNCVFTGGVRELDKIVIGKKVYYLDERLRQIREVLNPHNFYNLNDFEVYFYKQKILKQKIKQFK